MPRVPRNTSGPLAAITHSAAASATMLAPTSKGAKRRGRARPNVAAIPNPIASTRPINRSEAIGVSRLNAYPISAPATRNADGKAIGPTLARLTRGVNARAHDGASASRLAVVVNGCSPQAYSLEWAGAAADTRTACDHAAEYRRARHPHHPADRSARRRR